MDVLTIIDVKHCLVNHQYLTVNAVFVIIIRELIGDRKDEKPKTYL